MRTKDVRARTIKVLEEHTEHSPSECVQSDILIRMHEIRWSSVLVCTLLIMFLGYSHYTFVSNNKAPANTNFSIWLELFRDHYDG